MLCLCPRSRSRVPLLIERMGGDCHVKAPLTPRLEVSGESFKILSAHWELQSTSDRMVIHRIIEQL